MRTKEAHNQMRFLTNPFAKKATTDLSITDNKETDSTEEISVEAKTTNNGTEAGKEKVVGKKNKREKRDRTEIRLKAPNKVVEEQIIETLVQPLVFLQSNPTDFAISNVIPTTEECYKKAIEAGEKSVLEFALKQFLSGYRTYEAQLEIHISNIQKFLRDAQEFDAEVINVEVKRKFDAAEKQFRTKVAEALETESENSQSTLERIAELEEEREALILKEQIHIARMDGDAESKPVIRHALVLVMAALIVGVLSVVSETVGGLNIFDRASDRDTALIWSGLLALAATVLVFFDAKYIKLWMHSVSAGKKFKRNYPDGIEDGDKTITTAYVVDDMDKNYAIMLFVALVIIVGGAYVYRLVLSLSQANSSMMGSNLFIALIAFGLPIEVMIANAYTAAQIDKLNDIRAELADVEEELELLEAEVPEENGEENEEVKTAKSAYTKAIETVKTEINAKRKSLVDDKGNILTMFEEYRKTYREQFTKYLPDYVQKSIDATPAYLYQDGKKVFPAPRAVLEAFTSRVNEIRDANLANPALVEDTRIPTIIFPKEINIDEVVEEIKTEIQDAEQSATEPVTETEAAVPEYAAALFEVEVETPDETEEKVEVK